MTTSPRVSSLRVIAAMIAMGFLPIHGCSHPEWIREDPQRAQFAPTEILVQFTIGANLAEIEMARESVGAKRIDIVRDAEEGRLELLRLGPGKSVDVAVTELQSLPAVRFAEPNGQYFLSDVSNDPYYKKGWLWGMYGDSTKPAVRFGSQAGEKWNSGKSSCANVWVGVIDTGYMHGHEDLRDNAATNPGEIAGDGVDNDGNSHIDDVYGWDFVNNDNTVFDGTSDNHGTHVSGTIGARGGNKKGVAGICWEVKLINAKIFGGATSTAALAVKAVDYMTNLKVSRGINLVALNNSWGRGAYSLALKEAIDRAEAQDILFIAAAGNGSGDCDAAEDCFPAEYAHASIISVTSIDGAGNLSPFSNYGAISVDICAPGEDIHSTEAKIVHGVETSAYDAESGTSMATPHVTGAVALYKAIHTAATAAQVKAGILTRAEPTASCKEWVATEGRLDVDAF